MLMGIRQISGELEETISGISDIQVFNAQQLRSGRFHAVSESAAKNASLTKVWMEAGTGGAQVFIALSTALALIVGVAFSGPLG